MAVSIWLYLVCCATVSMGLVTTMAMAALVLGLLISSAKNFYDAQSSELMQISSQVILLDRLLTHYGSETKEIRDQLRGMVATVWIGSGRGKAHDRHNWERRPSPSMGIIGKMRSLPPKDDRQRSMQTQTVSVLMGLTQTCWMMYEQEANSVSASMLAILVFWLARFSSALGSSRHAPPPLSPRCSLPGCRSLTPKRRRKSAIWARLQQFRAESSWTITYSGSK